MIGCDAVLADGITMFLSGIALVGEPVVLGVFLSKTVHIIVTIGLGEDARSSDGEVFAVALDDRGVGDVVIRFEAVAIDDDGLRANHQLIQGTMHRKDGGIEDVDLVYLLRGDDSHGPGNGITFDDLPELITALLRQLLRVVEQVVLIVIRQDDGSRINTASQTTTSGFIAASFDLAYIVVILQHQNI